MYGYALEKAVFRGDFDAVKSLLNLEGADANHRNDTGYSLLELAVSGKRSEIVDILLAHEADPNPNSSETQGNDDRLLRSNPLTAAVMNKDYDICKLLLNNGANVNDYFWNYEITALQEVCADDIIFKLIKGCGMNVEEWITDYSCLTPLHFAAASNQPDIVKILLEHGANQDMKTFKNQQTALEMAICASSFDVYDYLLPITSGLNLDDILMYFGDEKNVNQVSQLLKSSIDPSDRNDQKDFTLPQRLSGFCYNESANFLIKFRAHVNTVFGENQLTPLHYSSSFGYSKMVKTMIETGNATVNVFDRLGSTPLFTACDNGHIDTVKILLEHGALPNITSSKKRKIPMKIACLKGFSEMVKILLKYEASVNRFDNDESTPLHAACLSGNVQVVKTLIEHGSHTNVLDKFGKIPLHYACYKGQPDVVNTLLEHGSLVNSADNNGDIPLHTACDYNRSDIIKILLHNGANRTLQNSYKLTVEQSPEEPIQVKVQALINEFLCSYSYPESLNTLVRDNIRKRLTEHTQGVYFQKSVDHLPLPKTVKTFIFTPLGT